MFVVCDIFYLQVQSIMKKNSIIKKIVAFVRDSYSIKKRIGLQFSLFMTAIVVFFSAVIYLLFVSNLQNIRDRELQNQTKNIINMLSNDENFSFANPNKQIDLMEIPDVIEEVKNLGYVVTIRNNAHDPFLRTTRDEPGI